MRIEQRRWTRAQGWSQIGGGVERADVVLAFGGFDATTSNGNLAALRAAFPTAHTLGCSTAGEICGIDVTDDTIVATAIQFEASQVAVASRELRSASESGDVAEKLARDLEPRGLAHVFVLAEGLEVNGTDLVAGLRRGLPKGVAATGGLAGDGDRFRSTVVWSNGAPRSRTVTALGLYGDRLRVGYGSLGGWDQFGPERLVTRAERNVLYELDGESALELYRRYLGPHANGLPATGPLFPLSLRAENGGERLVRTILGVDAARGSMTFAGDIPEGSHVQLMKANVDRLIDGATGAANVSHDALGTTEPELAILISCVGRKLVLKQRVEEEVESVREVLGAGAALTGFYSYGEIAPFSSSAKCELHNQTMTITTLSER